MIKFFDVCFSTLISTLNIVQILSTPCIGGMGKVADTVFHHIYRVQITIIFPNTG